MSHPDPLYDYDNSYEDDMNSDDYNDFHTDLSAEDLLNNWDDSYDDSMDGDHDSTMNSIGWDVDEGYGLYGEDY